jgi:hypothetical protein
MEATDRIHGSGSSRPESPDVLGVAIVALGGHVPHGYVGAVSGNARRRGRAAVLGYAGGSCPPGDDISRDFVERPAGFGGVVRITLLAAPVEAHAWTAQLGGAGDSRAYRFVDRHGVLVGGELHALLLGGPPRAARRGRLRVWGPNHGLEGHALRAGRTRTARGVGMERI